MAESISVEVEVKVWLMNGVRVRGRVLNISLIFVRAMATYQLVSSSKDNQSRRNERMKTDEDRFDNGSYEPRQATSSMCSVLHDRPF